MLGVIYFGIISHEKNSTRSQLTHTEIFNGSFVRRNFVSTVESILDKLADKREIQIVGNMVKTVVNTVWSIHGTQAVKTGTSWGRPSSLTVDNEAVRAEILKSIGVDLSQSRIYKKYF